MPLHGTRLKDKDNNRSCRKGSQGDSSDPGVCGGSLVPRSAREDLWLVLHMDMQRPSPMGLHLQQLGSLCTATPRVAQPTRLFTLHLPYHQVEQHRQAWVGHCHGLGYISSELTLNGTLYSTELGCECTKQASCFPFCLKDGAVLQGGSSPSPPHASSHTSLFTWVFFTVLSRRPVS